jgi:PST family polysaccharide transporter
LLLAYLGYGYWAIVSISLVNTTIQTVLLWMNCNWRPHRIKIDFSVRSYLKFGAGVTGFNMINYFSRNLDNILIGKYIGAFQLGLYSKAYQLLMLPINQLRDPLNAVGLPAMSSLRDEQHKYRHYYKEYLFILAFFSIPIVSFLYICANSLILIVLGPNWVASSKIFQLLAITGIIQPIASTRGMVLISTGQSGRYFKWGMWNAVFVIISFFAGLPFGINGIAIAYAIANYLILVPSLYYCFKNTPVQVGDFFYTCLPPFLIAVIAGLLTFFVKEHFDQLVPLTQVLVCLIVYSVSYWGLWMLTPFTRNRLLKISVILKNILNRKSNTELKQKRD